MNKLVIFESADIDSAIKNIYSSRCQLTKLLDIIDNIHEFDTELTENLLKPRLKKARKLLRDSSKSMTSLPSPTVIQANHFLDDSFNNHVCHGCGKKLK